MVLPGLNRLSRQGLLLLAGGRSAIDGTLVTTLTASSAGTVSYPLSPTALGLSTGHHVLTLQSMLITATADFTSR